MFTLFDGEKYYNKHGISNHVSNNIILDVKSDFLLKKLENCTFFDAVKMLHCAKKNVKDAIVRLIYPSKFNIFRKNYFYLQQIQIPYYSDISSKFRTHNLFVLEEIIATVCSSKVPDNQGWIYIAKHRYWRIVCGYKKGIILSRTLPENTSIDLEIERTLTYLKRFNLAENFHVFRLNYPSKIWNDFFKNSDDASVGICSLAEKLSISPIKKKKLSLKKSLDITSNLLFLLAFILTLFGVSLHMQNMNSVTNLPDFRIENKNIKAKITGNNIDEIEKFFGYFQKEFLPWNDFILVRKLFPNIIINKISMDKDTVKIYTTSSIKKNNNPNISVEKKNNESVICIKK